MRLIFGTADNNELDIVAPGCKKENFKVNIENNVLTVSFEQKREDHQQDKDAGWVRNEYMQRSFSRSFTLDDTVDLENVIFRETDEKIMHVSLPINKETVLMGADNTDALIELSPYNNFSLIVHADEKQEANRLFDELSNGGQIKLNALLYSSAFERLRYIVTNYRCLELLTFDKRQARFDIEVL